MPARLSIKTAILCLLFVFCSGCTHKVYRNSYRFDPNHVVSSDLVFKTNPGNPDSLINVGEIRLTDGWWVLICSEQEALALLKKEAHQLRADLVHISKEKRPDIHSSCYRCDATFYQYKHPGMKLQSDNAYTADAIMERHKKDNKKKFFLATGSVILGLSIGILIGITYL